MDGGDLPASGLEPFDRMLARSASRFGTPQFLYDTRAIEARIAELRAAFGGRFALSYAVKANPNPALLGWLRERIDFLDVSSIGEFHRARNAGWAPDRASFTGPGKRDGELREAIAGGLGELILESAGEARRANAIAGALGRRQDVMIRISPDRVPKGFGDHMAGRPSPFGVDVEEIDTTLPAIAALPNLRLAGLHIYSGTQCLRAEAIVENYAIFLDIFERVCARHDLAPRRLVFGSGLGIPYHEGDAPLDLGAVAAGIVPALDALRAKPRFAETRLALELGRYLVGEAGYFLTRVVAVKRSRGRSLAICDGGMNDHLPASGHFGMVIARNYRMHVVGGAGPAEEVDISGPLCTSIDRLARGARLPPLAEDDLIAVHQSGAYGPTASPLGFISHPAPVEVLLTGDGLVGTGRVSLCVERPR
ncbi:type III PLP-dependent enzyme [Amaricoccus solimangrovi]|uniref:Type III PLP-dependent enzyme n=1 Tax=Amaricoccus solimangrovi TaxID=2589815 RepID=A0A501WWK1_9RHOB|nr:type III PLP-dependent enzyme [Amaricoccus solimangrovi]TPE53102.1 type III PLP-dependent enzyme [Amaricoccus solimangrovi]